MIKRPSPLVQMTMALVALASTLVILGSLFLDTMPDRDTRDRAVRKAVGEALAVQMAEMLHRDDPQAIEKALAAIVSRTPDLRSIGVRRADGSLVLSTPAHEQQWRIGNEELSRPEQVSVPLSAQGQRWGRVEMAFAANDLHPVLAFLREPLVQMLLFISLAGWLVFGLYMRRALQHLDPSSVVPERVQGAFDAMAEGVVVLDARGRVMLCNRAFRALHPQLAEVPTGSNLAALPWLSDCLPEDPSALPWTRAMTERNANGGTALEAGQGDERRQLVVNAAPISDAGGAVRGCMVTFSDMSALHRANEALQETLDKLEASKREVEQKNLELERLATRDPLTGALNRRAFHAAFDALRQQAEGATLTVLMIDIDHFKSINDTHGHAVGDRVIQEVARKLQDCVRAADLLCRWGGEEFCIVAAGLAPREAADFAERARMRIERECGAALRDVPGLRVSASIGVEIALRGEAALAPLVEGADAALYRAKRAGRNRVALPEGGSELDEPVADAGKVDAASGCLNIGGWVAALPRLRDAARAQDRVLGCVMLTLDDAAGIAARQGIDALQRATSVLGRWAHESAPGTAAVARLDERRIALMVPGMGLSDGRALAEHLRGRVEEGLAREVDGLSGEGLTVSAGVDALPATAPGAATLGDRAEAAMNRARRAGGNRVTLFARSVDAPSMRQEPRA